MQDPKRSRLKELVPRIGNFYTNLHLSEALNEYDQFFALSRRRYVPPNFAEIRHVLNIAQASPHCLGHWSAAAACKSRLCSQAVMMHALYISTSRLH